MNRTRTKLQQCIIFPLGSKPNEPNYWCESSLSWLLSRPGWMVPKKHLMTFSMCWAVWQSQLVKPLFSPLCRHANGCWLKGSNNQKKLLKGRQMKLQQLYTTVLSAQTGTCSEMPPPRRTIIMCSFPNQKAWMNGEVGPYPESKKLPFCQVTRKHRQSETESWHQGGKAETSGETGDRPQHQQHQRYVESNPDHHRLQNPLCSLWSPQQSVSCQVYSASRWRYPQRMWEESFWDAKYE